MFAPEHDFEVLRPVIKPVLVPMVDHFIATKRSAKNATHDQDVLANVPVLASVRMLRHKDCPVAVSKPDTTFPVSILPTVARTTSRHSEASLHHDYVRVGP